MNGIASSSNTSAPPSGPANAASTSSSTFCPTCTSYDQLAGPIDGVARDLTAGASRGTTGVGCETPRACGVHDANDNAQTASVAVVASRRVLEQNARRLVTPCGVMRIQTTVFAFFASRVGEYEMSNQAASLLHVVRARALSVLESLEPVAMLLARLAVGLLFESTGWGKVHNIPKVTEFFVKLGSPFPGFQAVLVGWSELLCGTALVIGLFTRLATIPLIVSMVVAILTAKLADIHGVFDLVGQDEFTYLVMLIVIAVVGPGKFSLDRLIARRLDEAA
jgi:putative oxidoreductase